jgi:hypothetical protein
LDAELEVHGPFSEARKLVSRKLRQMVDFEVVDAIDSRAKVLPPKGRTIVKGIDRHLVATGRHAENPPLVWLSYLDPLHDPSRVVALPQCRFVGVPHISGKFQRPVISVDWSIEGVGQKTSHHPLICFGRMASDRDGEVCVSIPIQIGQFDAGFMDDGLHLGGRRLY